MYSGAIIYVCMNVADAGEGVVNVDDNVLYCLLRVRAIHLHTHTSETCTCTDVPVCVCECEWMVGVYRGTHALHFRILLFRTLLLMLLLLFFHPQSRCCLYIFLQLHDSRAARLPLYFIASYIYTFIIYVCIQTRAHTRSLTHSHHKNFLPIWLFFLFVLFLCVVLVGNVSHFIRIFFCFFFFHRIVFLCFVSWISFGAFFLSVPFASSSSCCCRCCSSCFGAFVWVFKVAFSECLSSLGLQKTYNNQQFIVLYACACACMYVCYDVTQHVIMQSHTHFKIKQICPPCTPPSPSSTHTIPSQLAMYDEAEEQNHHQCLYACLWPYALKQK